MDNDPACRYLGALDAAANGSYHSDRDPDPDIPVCLVVGLTPIGGKETGQALHHVLHLCDQQAVE